MFWVYLSSIGKGRFLPCLQKGMWVYPPYYWTRRITLTTVLSSVAFHANIFMGNIPSHFFVADLTTLCTLGKVTVNIYSAVSIQLF